jgi:hypothetical protein
MMSGPAFPAELMKILKYVLLVLAAVLLGLIIAAAVGLHYLRGVPRFYRIYKWNDDDRNALANQVDRKISNVRETMAHAWSLEKQPASAATPAHVGAVTLTLTEDEVNAGIAHGSEMLRVLQVQYPEYLKDPGIFFQDGCIILAGQASGYVVSFQFRPAIDPDGRLRLDLVKATGGRLTLPRALLDSQLGKLREAIDSKMPQWKTEAEADKDGVVNRSTMAAVMGNLLLCAVSNKPAAPVLFVPLDEPGKKLLPIRVEAAKVENESLTLKLAPMDRKAREAVVGEVKGK